jgi:thiol-disulfide isomerase/thioredoxin
VKTIRGAWCVVCFVLAVGLGTPGRVVAQDDELGIAIGTRPPAVTIEDLDGRPVDLDQFIGKKPVLLEFWATWCPLCAALFPRIEAAQARFGNQVEFVVIAVGVNQSQRTIKRHLTRHPMPFRVLWDSNGQAVRAFQAPSTSYVVVLDSAGKVAYTGLGAEQDIEAALRRVTPSH